MEQIEAMLVGGLLTCLSLGVVFLININLKSKRLRPTTLNGHIKLAKILKALSKKSIIEAKNSWGFSDKEIQISGVSTPIFNMSETVRSVNIHGIQLDWQLDLSIDQAKSLRDSINDAIKSVKDQKEAYQEYLKKEEEEKEKEKKEQVEKKILSNFDKNNQ